MRQKIKIGIIGFGNMGKAIAEKLKINYEISAYDINYGKTEGVSGVTFAQNIDAVFDGVSIVIVAVKPQDFRALLDTIKPLSQNKLIISIAAGISTSFIERRLSNTTRVIRVMPNMPAKLGEGISCLSKGEFATSQDLGLAEEIFKHLGETLLLKEDTMDAATAISGSGPGYLCDFIEQKNIGPNIIPEEEIKSFKNDFIKAARIIGFNEKEAIKLVEATINGTLQMLKRCNLTPSQLKDQVASRGGTTEAGLNVWHESGSLNLAVRAALTRAKELTK